MRWEKRVRSRTHILLFGLYNEQETRIDYPTYLKIIGNYAMLDEFYSKYPNIKILSPNVEDYFRLNTAEFREIVKILVSLDGIDPLEEGHDRKYNYSLGTEDPNNWPCKLNCTGIDHCQVWKGDKETGPCYLDPGSEAWKMYEQSTCEILWDFEGALYFCFTVISTIGYGNIAPRTRGGRIFFLFYCIPGIGIFGVVLARIQAIFKHVIDHGERLYKRRTNNTLLRLYWISVFVALLGLFWLVPAALLHVVAFQDEANGFLDSMYFTMVTFTTVGFGDLSITEHNYKFFNVFLTYLGYDSL